MLSSIATHNSDIHQVTYTDSFSFTIQEADGTNFKEKFLVILASFVF